MPRPVSQCFDDARAEVAEHLAPRRHPLAELVGERRDHRLRHPECAQPGARDRDVVVRARLPLPPLLVARDQVGDLVQPGSSAGDLPECDEHVRRARVGIPVRPQHVALDVRTIDLGRHADRHQNSSVNACQSSSGPRPWARTAKSISRERASSARLHLRDRGVRIRGDEEPGVDLVVEQVCLQLRTRRVRRAADAPAPDLFRLGRQLHAQLVEVGIERAVEVAREDQVSALEMILSRLRGIVHPVVQDHPAGEVGTGQPRQWALVLTQRAEERTQRRLLARLDRGERHERGGLARAVAHRQSCTSARNSGHCSANASALMFAARALNASSFGASSSADRTIVVVASGYAP